MDDRPIPKTTCISVYDERMMRDIADNMCRRILDAMESFRRDINRISAEFFRADCSGADAKEALFSDKVNSRIPFFYSELIRRSRWFTVKINNIVSRLPGELDTVSINPLNSNLKDFAQQARSVDVHLEADAMYFKLPKMWSQFSLNGRLAAPQHSRLFSTELSHRIESCESPEGYDFERYARKLIQYVHVYNDLDTGHPADNDNYDIKNIQDTICSYTPTGDDPFSTFIFVASAVSDDIEEGTYVCVTPLDGRARSIDEILSYWKAH